MFFYLFIFYLQVLMRRIAMKLAVTLITRETRIPHKTHKEVHKSCAVCQGHLLIIELRGEANVQLGLIMHINDTSRIHHWVLFLLQARGAKAPINDNSMFTSGPPGQDAAASTSFGKSRCGKRWHLSLLGWKAEDQVLHHTQRSRSSTRRPRILL